MTHLLDCERTWLGQGRQPECRVVKDMLRESRMEEKPKCSNRMKLANVRREQV